MSLTNGFEGTLEEFSALSDNAFAEEWRLRYLAMRAQMIPDIARWLRLLRFFHPRRLEDHWQDQYGNPLPKLYKSEGLSVEIYNWCRPIIEVYGSLLAGQKPMPFKLNIPPTEANDPVERFRAEAQEKVFEDELFRQKIPLHFLDFCTSVVLFGIGYVCSWIDPRTGKLRTQSLPWPGDVLPQWGSDRYGSGADGMESVIITERISLDAARRLYGDKGFVSTATAFTDLRNDGNPQAFGPNTESVLLLKIWWRWADDKGKEKVGYAVVAYDGVTDGNGVLYRADESGYPDIPIRWAARFNTPTEPPHRAAGVLDDIVGINTEYNEKFSAMADMIMGLVYRKYKAKGFAPGKAPRLTQDSNMYTLSFQQDIEEIQQTINNFPFDSFLTRLETMMFTVSGLSRLMMGSMPPGDTSGEALSNLLHAAIGRLEGVRTPIQWAWMSMFDDIWAPMIRDRYKVKHADPDGKMINYSLKPIFMNFTHTNIIWPDVTPRDQLKAIQVAMEMNKAKLLSREGAMERAQVPSVVDEIEKIRREAQDIITNPMDVSATANAQLSKIQIQQVVQENMAAAQAQQQAMKTGAKDTDNQRKAEASKTPGKSEADNKAPKPSGSQENASQGYNNGGQ
jgi:hypothetical protein